MTRPGLGMSQMPGSSIGSLCRMNVASLTIIRTSAPPTPPAAPKAVHRRIIRSPLAGRLRYAVASPPAVRLDDRRADVLTMCEAVTKHRRSFNPLEKDEIG